MIKRDNILPTGPCNRSREEMDRIGREFAREFPCGWNVGDRIFHHPEFGGGTVVAFRGQRLTVEFDRAGRQMVWGGLCSLLRKPEDDAYRTVRGEVRRLRR